MVKKTNIFICLLKSDTSHDSPVNSGKQLQVPLLQSPLNEQLLGQVRLSQASPSHPGSQTIVLLSFSCTFNIKV